MGVIIWGGQGDEIDASDKEADSTWCKPPTWLSLHCTRPTIRITLLRINPFPGQSASQLGGHATAATWRLRPRQVSMQKPVRPLPVDRMRATVTTGNLSETSRQLTQVAVGLLTSDLTCAIQSPHSPERQALHNHNQSLSETSVAAETNDNHKQSPFTNVF